MIECDAPVSGLCDGGWKMAMRRDNTFLTESPHGEAEEEGKESTREWAHVSPHIGFLHFEISESSMRLIFSARIR